MPEEPNSQRAPETPTDAEEAPSASPSPRAEPRDSRLRESAGRIVSSRYALWVGVLLALSLGTYLTLLTWVNSALALNVPSWAIAQETDDLKLTLGHAYILWPTRVHFKDADVEIHDSAVHVRIRVPRGSVQVDVGELFSQRFVGSDLRAEGLLIEARTVRAVSKAREPALPPLSAPKVPQGITDPADLWGVELQITRLTIADLWINDLRVPGWLSLEGGFDLQPMRHLEVMPSHLKTLDEPVSLKVGDQPLLAALTFDLKPQVARTDVSGDALPGLMQGLSLDGQIDAQVQDLALLNPQLGGSFRLRDGKGPLKLRIALEQMVLKEPTHLRYRSRDVTLHAARLNAQGRAYIAVKSKAGTLTTTSYLRGLTLTRERTVLAQLRRAKARIATGTNLKELRIKHGQLDVSGLEAPDVSELRYYLPHGIQSAKGSVLATASATFRKNSLSAALDARWQDASATVGESKFAGDVWFSAKATSEPPFTKGKFTALNLDLKQATISTGKEPSPSFNVTLRGNAVDYTTKPLKADGLLRLTVSDTTALEQAGGVDPPDLVAKLFGLGDVELLVDTSMSKSQQDIRIVGGRSGSAELFGQFKNKAGGVGVALLIKNGVLSVGVAARGGEVSITPFAGQGWLTENVRAL